jgi:hypothetical protein
LTEANKLQSMPLTEWSATIHTSVNAQQSKGQSRVERVPSTDNTPSASVTEAAILAHQAHVAYFN